MKKFIYTMGIIAAAAFTFSSCQKEQTVNEQPSDKLVTITFTADKAGFVTKTAAIEGEEEVSYKWTDEDILNLKLFEKSSDGKISQIVSPTFTKVSDTKLTISTEVAVGSHTFYAILSNEYTGSGSDFTTRKPRIKATQTPNGIENFDPNADFLKSDDLEVNVTSEGSTDDLLMKFRRHVVINKMTLKNMVAGEKVSKVVITSNNEITGYLDGSEMSGQKKTIELQYNNVTVPEGGLFPVYFVTMAGTGHSLTVEVTTDQNTYSKSFAEEKTIAFVKGQFTKFNIALPNGVANQSLSLPFEDDMSCADNGGEDGDALTSADLTKTDQNNHKYYSAVSYGYKGASGLKLGKSSELGSITTSEIDLSSAYTIVVSAKTWNTDVSQLEVSVDGSVIGKTGNLYNEYAEYVFHPEEAASNASVVSFKITGKRGYINSIQILSGSTYSPKPVIILNGDIVRTVGSSSSSGSIQYSLVNPIEGQSVSASSNATWLSVTANDDGGFDYSIEANTSEERTGVITLSYNGAVSKTVKVVQSAYVDPSSAIEYSFTITPEYFNSTSYAANNNEKTTVATATDGSGKTMNVVWISNQIMKSPKSGDIQWQSGKGYIYNNTDLGTVTEVTITSTGGTFTKTIGTTSQPSTDGEGGFFMLKVGNATGYASKILVKFKK